MNRNRLEILGSAAWLLLLSAALSGCMLGPKTPSPELSERIEAALQHSDHEGLVAYYKAEAAAARDKVASQVGGKLWRSVDCQRSGRPANGSPLQLDRPVVRGGRAGIRRDSQREEKCTHVQFAASILVMV